MKKLILPFFVLLVGAYFGYYLIMEDYPPTGPAENANLVLRVGDGSGALECTVAFMSGDSPEPLLRSQREKQYLGFFDIPEGADFIRINYSTGGGKYTDADIPLEYTPGEPLKMTVDPAAGTADYDISYKDYLLGFALGQGPMNLLRYLYRAVMYYILWVAFPFIWLVTGYTLFREYRKGLRRRFAGSWAYLIIGVLSIAAVRFATNFFAWMGGTWPGLVRTAFWFLMLGYPLYFVAYLVLDEDKVLGAEYRLLDEYFTYEEYQLSDGNCANGFVIAWQDRGVGGILGWLFGAVLLPLSTYMRLILYYVTPFVSRSKTWAELTPIEPPRPFSLLEKMQSRLPRQSAEAEPEDEDTEEAPGGEEAGAAANVADTGKRRRRKRHRPQRKAPYVEAAAPEDAEEAKGVDYVAVEAPSAIREDIEFRN